MANETTKKLRLDVPTGIRAGFISAVLGIAVIILLNFFDVLQIDFIVRPLAFILAGMLYMRSLSKAELSYLEAAAGGAVSGGVGGFLFLVVGALLDATLNEIFPYTQGLGGLSQTSFTRELLTIILTGAMFGAIGSAWSVLVRTQRIKD